MKKSLSILLSLLMILGTITCMFTVPVSAEETVPAAQSGTETMPDEGLVESDGDVTITPSTNASNANGEYGTAAIYNFKEGGTTLSNSQYIQINVTVTTSADMTEGAKLYPAYHVNGVEKAPPSTVGVRSDVTTPTVVETAYNWSNVTTTPDLAVAMQPGKTYTYTYLFARADTPYDQLRFQVSGLASGSVTLSNISSFRVDNHIVFHQVISINGESNPVPVIYLVEEDGNVFTRIYGYAPVNVTGSAKGYSVSAKYGKEFYNIDFKGGKEYEMTFDARYNVESSKGFTNANGSFAVAFDFYETGAFDYLNDYAGIKDPSNTDTVIKNLESSTTKQRTYAPTSYGYSYFYAGSGSNTYSRRPVKNIASMTYYNADGSKIGSYNQETGSAQGRTAPKSVATSTWVKGVYNINTTNAMSLEETATLGKSLNKTYDSYMRYTYDGENWPYHSEYRNIYSPADQDVKVALGLDYIYAHGVYDFDNIKVNEVINRNLKVEYKNPAGEVISLPADEAPAVITENGTKAVISDHDNTDAFTFEGWYLDGEFAGKEASVEMGKAEEVKAVIVYENLLKSGGSFENYTTNNTNLTIPVTSVGKPGSTAAIKDEAFAGLSKDFYNTHTEAPSDEKWGYFNSEAARKATPEDEAILKAAGYNFISTTGTWGPDNYFKITATQTASNPVVNLNDDGSVASGTTTVTVNPHRGNWMLQDAVKSRTAMRAISGLEIGTNYVLSFYVWNPTKYNYVQNAGIIDTFNKAADLTKLGVNNNGVNTLATTGALTANDMNLGGWTKITLEFMANKETLYFAMNLYNSSSTTGNNYTYLDDMVLRAKGTLPTTWDFEDEDMTGVYKLGGDLRVVDAVGQADKIGNKYLQYTTSGFQGFVFNFKYEAGYKYIISYDMKVFTYGTGEKANGMDGYIGREADHKYGADGGVLQTGDKILVTRYWENGQTFEKATRFSQDTNNYLGRTKVDGVYTDELPGGEIWNEWQHFVVEIEETDYEGLAEYGIRPNDAGWVIGVDNFKVEKVATATLDEARNAFTGTHAFNIRSATTGVKQGLRFKSTIDLDELNLSDGAKIVEYGTLAAKKQDLVDGYYLKRDAAKDKAKNGRVVAGVAYSEADGIDVRYAHDGETNELVYTGVLTGISADKYDIVFAVCAYVVVETADGKRMVVYGDVVNLSVYDAATQIIAKNTNADDVAAAQAAIDAYNATKA